MVILADESNYRFVRDDLGVFSNGQTVNVFVDATVDARKR